VSLSLKPPWVTIDRSTDLGNDKRTGYDAPKMLAHYAAFIDERIKAYRDLRRDVIRTSDSGKGGGNSSEGASSGHRLRRLTVEKGLLREVAVAQKVCSRLLDLFFSYFSDNTQDEMAMTAFRMSLKDLLAIYAAINEGVINILGERCVVPVTSI
jgi:hypothetical protein